MENKTLSYLNTKAWYRFLKVIYVAMFALALLIGNISIYATNGIKSVDGKKTEVACKSGKTFSLSDINASLDSTDFPEGIFDYSKFYQGYNDYDIKLILERCLGINKVDDIFLLQKVQEFKGHKGNPENLSAQDLSDLRGELSRMQKDYDKKRYLDYSAHLFEIKPVFNYITPLLIFLFINLTILTVFESLKRAFYYVFLGKLRPPKQ